MSAVTITISIDPDDLANVTDGHLNALWHIAQTNPAPFGDKPAGELVDAISDEIIQRWLSTAHVERFRHRPDHHAFKTLRQHGSWVGPDGAWQPNTQSESKS